MELKTKLTVFLILIVLAGSTREIFANDWERIVNLKGYWRFSIGDDMNWALPGYNDNNWEEIKVPSSWEDEGFHGYNGYAWYRRSFEMPSAIPTDVVYLELGVVDDVDEVYVNGNLIGFSGTFPPDYESAYWLYRKYPIPIKYLKPKGKNVIAVRVYDSEQVGGIIGGNNIGLYIRPYALATELSLEGEWKFKTGDNKNWKDPGLNDKDWSRIIVPGFWEPQGYPKYNGFGWYRLKFNVPAKFKDKKLVLVLGKIDDVDEVYLNGQLVGSTGKIYDDPSKIRHDKEYQQLRGYYLPDGILKINQDNVVAVRVYDGYRDGGIYEGPVGLITQEKYTKFWRDKKRKVKKPFDTWFDDW
ncbi:MAG: beta galactosidase jelly roll domain-containing protein [Ignavibacteriaceae bacterium]